jgi:hypothetical protein
MSARAASPPAVPRRGPPLAGVPAALQRPVVLGVLLASVLAGTALAFAPAADLPRAVPTEDGFYALAVARHIGMGDAITIDGVHRTNGIQPLWSFLCAPLYALAGGNRILGLRLTELLGTALWLAFAALLAVHARDLARRHGLRGDFAAAAAAIVAVGSVSVFRVFHNGLETGLLLVVLCAAVLMLDRTERWTARRTVAVGLLLGALAWSRLDALAFVAAAGAVAVAGWLARRRALPVAPLAACALAGLLLVPWLAYGVSLDGHLLPTGARAQEVGLIDTAHNARSALRAVGAWILAPALRPAMRFDAVAGGGIASDVAAGVGIALFALAVGRLARGRGVRAGPGTAALGLYVGFLLAFYTFEHGAWWFQDRYLAPMVVLAVPVLAGAAEAVLGGRTHAAGAALAVVVAVLNLPLFAVLLAAPRDPPGWAAGGSTLGTKPNANVVQAEWALRRVRRGCRVAAWEAGTLIYFRDRTLNLDGKVNPAALRARAHRTLPGYVARSRIDVLVDWKGGIAVATVRHRRQWRRVADLGRFAASVRRGRGGCLRSPAHAPEQGAGEVAQHREHPAQDGRRPHRVGAPAQA